ncbi:MAG: hypothetical protein MRZ31_06600, partial [Dysosmobacter sp.]|uniref:hypothetical protein n=1 Tax=Dysosmobacter sp. TaxID=2591382 RepID=UPI002671F89A
HSRRAGAHTVLTAMAFGDQGFRPESALLSSTILDFVENRLHKILRPAARQNTLSFHAILLRTGDTFR